VATLGEVVEELLADLLGGEHGLADGLPVGSAFGSRGSTEVPWSGKRENSG
jgi:hypothetical protein